MALALTPRLLRRGLELFAIISLAGVIVVLAVYGESVQAVGSALLHLHWGWLVVGLGLASMDWIGGGLRLWVVARHVHPGGRLKALFIAGGMSAWAAYLTPFQSGAGPTMMWVMRRAGVRLPEAMTSTFMTFVATVVFFATAGPLAIYLGAGKSLEQHNVILGITYYGLFRTSLTIFGILGIVMLIAMVFPAWLRDAVHWLAGRLERRSHRIAARIEQLRDRDHRLAALLALAAERAGRAGGSGEHRVKCVSLRGYAVGRNFRLPDGMARTRRQEVHHPGGRGDARQRCQLRNPPQRRRRATAARPAPGPGRRAGDHPESVPRRRRPHQRRPPRRRADTPPARRQGRGRRSRAHLRG